MGFSGVACCCWLVHARGFSGSCCLCLAPVWRVPDYYLHCIMLLLNTAVTLQFCSNNCPSGIHIPVHSTGTALYFVVLCDAHDAHREIQTCMQPLVCSKQALHASTCSNSHSTCDLITFQTNFGCKLRMLCSPSGKETNANLSLIALVATCHRVRAQAFGLK